MKILNGRDEEWIECNLNEYNYLDRINYIYIVDENTNEVTYYKQINMKVYDAEWFENKEKEGKE